LSTEKVLIVEDEQNIAELASIKLSNAGYRVLTASNGGEALAKIEVSTPDLILLDTTLPDRDGYEVCYELRRNSLFRHLPIILMLGKDQDAEQAKGLGLRIDDILIKPFSPRDVLDKVNKLIAKARYLKEASPLTGWPGKQMIFNELVRFFSEERSFDLLAFDIDNFRIYNQIYSFAKGNEVIKMLAQSISDALLNIEELEYYLCHTGGDEFMLLLPFGAGEAVAKDVMHRFEVNVVDFYSEEDRARRGVISRDRQGVSVQWPIMTLSVALVTDQSKRFSDPLEVDSAALELIRYAKSRPGSNFACDKRQV